MTTKIPIFPLSQQYRDQLVGRLDLLVGAQDPLSVIQLRVFSHNPNHAGRIPRQLGRPPAAFYGDVVYYCEMSAWSETPPLIVALLQAFLPAWSDQDLISAIIKEGPFRCHPSSQPIWVCRVATELPLIKRYGTRLAAQGFGQGSQLAGGQGQWGKRVLRVFGPKDSGKSYTFKFFEYLAAIQPMQVGVLHFDFAESDISTLAANEDIPVELYLARGLEAQARRRREELNAQAVAATGANHLPDLGALVRAAGTKPYIFQRLTDIQQRNRWCRELANELVDQVLYRLPGVPPSWWVAVFDTCEKAPPEAQEFIRRLVERAAGTGLDDAEEANKGPLRVVLLGDSDACLPNPVYQDHVLDEDLTAQVFELEDVKYYFKVFCLSRGIKLDEDDDKHDARLQILAQDSLVRAQEIVNTEQAPPPWPKALARAVIEKTLPLEAQAVQKRS